MKKIIILPILMFILLTLTGCWDQQPIEHTGLVSQLGMESTPDNKLLITHVVPLINKPAKNYDELFATKANLLEESRAIGSLFASGEIEYKKVQQILFSRELAEKGIHNLFEGFERDPVKPLHPFLIIVEGSPGELLEKTVNLKDKPRLAIYLNRLLKENIGKSYIPDTRIGDFDISYYAPGLDPMIPVIKLEPEGIKITGTALFSEDKMVGKIGLQQTALLLAMMNKPRKIELTLKSEKLFNKDENSKNGIVVLITKAKRKLEIIIKDNKPVINLSLQFQGNLTEYRWNHLDDGKTQEKIEKKLSNEIKMACLKVIKYTQEVGSDPIGIGDLIRANHNSYWKKVNWIEVYRDVEIKINAKLDINQYGMIN